MLYEVITDQTAHAEEAISQIADFCDHEDWIMELRVAKDKSTVESILKRARTQCAM